MIKYADFIELIIQNQRFESKLKISFYAFSDYSIYFFGDQIECL